MDPRGLQSLLNLKDITYELLPKFMTEDAATCSTMVENIVRPLREERELEAERVEDPSQRRFQYAQRLSEYGGDVRDEFFTQILVCIDRQSSTHTRKWVLNFLAEIVAIAVEYAPASVQDSFEFSKRALETLREIMRAVPSVKEAFIFMIDQSLEKIIDSMSQLHVVHLLPILIDMVQDKNIGSELIKRFYSCSTTFIECYEFCTLLMMRGDVKDPSADGVIVELPHLNTTVRLPVTPVHAFENICTLMALCCKNHEIAKEFCKEEKGRQSIASMVVTTKRLYTQKKVETHEDHCRICSVHRLMGALARHNSAAADLFASPAAKAVGEKATNDRKAKQAAGVADVVLGLVRDVQRIDDGTKKGRRSVMGQHVHDATTLECLTGILSQSEVAAKFMSTSVEITPGTFVNSLVKIAKNTEKGSLIGASMDAMLGITNTRFPQMETFKKALENDSDIIQRLQEIMKTLINSVKTWGSGEQQAIMCALGMMKIYSQDADMSTKLNEKNLDGMDREDLTFWILNTKEEAVTEEVKLAAAEVLRIVPMTEFNKQEVREVVTIFSSVPTIMSEKTYEIMANLLFLVFKMALDEGDSLEAKSDEPSCGSTFRDIYATEVVNAVVNILARALEGDLADPETPISVNKRNFETACVKFLMTAWKQVALRDGLLSESVVNTLRNAMEVEQTVLHTWAYGKNADCDQYMNHDHLFLEQTYIGYPIENLLGCIEALKYRDLVAFRLFHQIGNILQNVRSDVILERLEHAAAAVSYGAQDYKDPFVKWNQLEKCGRSIEDMCAVERQLWSDRLELLPTRWKVRKAKYEDFRALAEVQHYHAKSFFHMRDDSKDPTTEKIETWNQLLNKKDARMDHWVMYREVKGDDKAEDLTTVSDEVVAFIGGGPLKKIFGDENDDDAEMYGLYVNPKHATGMREMVSRQLLAVFSHEMYLKGYRRCRTWVHESEKSFFEAASNGGAVCANPDAKPPTSEFGDKVSLRPYQFDWDLAHNVWVKTSARNLVANEGVEKMVYFLVKKEDEMLRNYDPTTADDSLRTTIVAKLEHYGAELMKILDEGKDAVMPASQTQLDESTSVALLLEVGFKSSAAPELIQVIQKPVWDYLISGTPEENFLQSTTFALQDEIPTYAPNVIPWILDQTEEKRLLQMRRLEMALKVQTKSEKLERARRTQLPLLCSAMMRAFYVLITGSPVSIQEDALKALRSPRLFHSLRRSIEQVNYGFRTSVTTDMVDEFGIGLKFIALMEEIILFVPVGLKDSLNAMRLYEIINQVIQAYFDRLVTVIRSRNESVDDILHRLRSMHPYEELVLYRVVRLASQLVSQVAFVQLFQGSVDVPKIYQGNKMCRAKALQSLFGENRAFQQCLQIFLLYDQELETSQTKLHVPIRYGHNNDKTTKIEAAYASVGTAAGNKLSGEYRDNMRIYIVEILAQLSSFDPQFKYQLLQNYSKGVVEADMSLRPSFLHTVLSASEACTFRTRLEAMLLHRRLLEDGEMIIDHSFVDHNSVGNTKLMVLTNKHYYISNSTYGKFESTTDMDKFHSLQQLEYKAIVKIWDGLGGQLFALQRLRVPTGLAIVDSRCDVFLNRTFGVSQRLVNVFRRFCRDDLNQPLQIFPTFVSGGSAVDARRDPHVALRNRIEEVALLEAMRQHPDFRNNKELPGDVRLFTYAYVMRNGKPEPRALALLSRGSVMILVSCAFALENWEPICNVEHAKSFLRFSERIYFGHAESIEFTTTASPIMVITTEDGPFSVFFACDTARMQWRRVVKEFVDSPQWKSALLPNMHAQDKHTRKLL